MFEVLQLLYTDWAYDCDVRFQVVIWNGKHLMQPAINSYVIIEFVIIDLDAWRHQASTWTNVGWS